MHLESSSRRAGSLALTWEWSGEGRGSSIFGEGTLEARAILKFGLGFNLAFKASPEPNSLALELTSHRSSFMCSDHRFAHPDEPVA